MGNLRTYFSDIFIIIILLAIKHKNKSQDVLTLYLFYERLRNFLHEVQLNLETVTDAIYIIYLENILVLL